MRKEYLLILGLVIVVVLFFFYDTFTNQEILDVEEVNEELVEETEEEVVPDIEIVAEGLEVPWEIVFLPDESMLITERPGFLTHIDKEGNKRQTVIEDVLHTGEGGLLGMALHPNFEDNGYLYLYISQAEGKATVNKVIRYVYDGEAITEDMVVIDKIKGAKYHNGGRIEFGPDGKLYITTGDATNEDLSQEKLSLSGKILRINDDGTRPEDNPFGTRVWSYGHRNSQGLAWDDKGNLWSTEHGRTTLTLTGMDEVNLIEPGKNYGWPLVEGDKERSGMILPVIHSGPDETWAPAAAVYWDGSIFFTGLRGETLYEGIIRTDNSIVTLKKHFVGEYGRLRALVIGPDDMMYLSTSNQDGRGDLRPGDDKIIRINPKTFR